MLAEKPCDIELFESPGPLCAHIPRGGRAVLEGASEPVKSTNNILSNTALGNNHNILQISSSHLLSDQGIYDSVIL